MGVFFVILFTLTSSWADGKEPSPKSSSLFVSPPDKTLKNECNRLIDQYKAELIKMSRVCKSDQDCALYPAVWNSCVLPRVGAKDLKLESRWKKIEELKKSAVNGCEVLHPPCPALPQAEPKCVKGQCEAVETRYR